MKIKHYQGTIATLKIKWTYRETLRDIINRRKNAQRNARLVNIFTK